MGNKSFAVRVIYAILIFMVGAGLFAFAAVLVGVQLSKLF